LRMGDEVITRFGGVRRIKWIGRQGYDPRFLRNNREKWPVRIAAGALGDFFPTRDLLVSPGHSMLLNRSLALAKNLINGVTITQQVPSETQLPIEYIQLDLGTHDCVFAEGAWSETFADAPGLRNQFHNVAEFQKLFPDYCTPKKLRLCAPRPDRGNALHAALAQVVARATATIRPGPLTGYIDIAAGRRIEGWAMDLHHPELPVLLEIVVEDRVIGTALACDARADLLALGKGLGRCAFFFTAPVKLSRTSLRTLQVRRTDGAHIAMSDDCRASLGGTRTPCAILGRAA